MIQDLDSSALSIAQHLASILEHDGGMKTLGIGFALFSLTSSAGAAGYIGATTLSILDSTFCKKYKCKFIDRNVMPFDYDIPHAVLYRYKISTNQNVAPILNVMRLNGKIIEISLPNMKYSNATRGYVRPGDVGIIPPILKDFFILSLGHNNNKKLWDVYYQCGRTEELPNYYGKGLTNAGDGYLAFCGLNLSNAVFSIFKR